MKTICAWCGITLEDEEGSSGLVSHGICIQCAVEVESPAWQGRPQDRGTTPPSLLLKSIHFDIRRIKPGLS